MKVFSSYRPVCLCVCMHGCCLQLILLSGVVLYSRPYHTWSEEATNGPSHPNCALVPQHSGSVSGLQCVLICSSECTHVCGILVCAVSMCFLGCNNLPSHLRKKKQWNGSQCYCNEFLQSCDLIWRISLAGAPAFNNTTLDWCVLMCLFEYPVTAK